LPDTFLHFSQGNKYFQFILGQAANRIILLLSISNSGQPQGSNLGEDKTMLVVIRIMA
jgi:hypothetical protein